MTLISIKTFPSRIEAEIAKSKLKAHGIDSHISADDAGGMAPAPMAYSPGARLKVRDEDAEKAREVLLEPSGEN